MLTTVSAVFLGLGIYNLAEDQDVLADGKTLTIAGGAATAGFFTLRCVLMCAAIKMALSENRNAFHNQRDTVPLATSTPQTNYNGNV